MKKICVVTGTRAEYGIMKVLINKIILSRKLELLLYVTGTHLLWKHGHTIDLIRKDELKIDREVCMYDEDSKEGAALGTSISEAIYNFTCYLNVDKPDLVLVLGDRFEIFCAVIAAVSLRIPIAHIHGGDHNFQGQVDEQIRHSITHFSNVHFPASQKSAERLIKLGEEPERIHMCGSPGIDMMLNYRFYSKNEIFKRLNLDANKKTIICIFHPYIPKHEKMGYQMQYILNSLLRLENSQTVVIYPNNDLGSDLIIGKIKMFERESYKNLKIFKNLDRIEFLSLLKQSDLMVGNSSSGIIDSASFHLPVINIGKRNFGRESAENVINISYKGLDAVLDIALSEKFKLYCRTVKNPYGDGNASEKIVKVLEDLDFDGSLLRKRFIL